MDNLVLSAKAKAKINLFLHVTGLRDDGYHDLESHVVFADFCTDNITIKKSNHFKLDVTGHFASKLSNQGENLITKAHKAIENYTGLFLPCHITLEKNIPIGAGLGGGSSDCAMTIRLMEELFEIDIPIADKNKILLNLGADVPVCYKQKTSFFSGIGNDVRPAPQTPPLHFLIVWPDIHSNTKDVFRSYTQNFSKPQVMPSSFIDIKDFVDFLKETKNDLIPAAQGLYPDIKTGQDWMGTQEGCLIARMSGSGSSIFGIFENRDLCEKAHKNAQNHIDWWASYGKIGG